MTDKRAQEAEHEQRERRERQLRERARDEGFDARKARAEELARLTVANRRKAAQKVQHAIDEARRFKDLTDEALEAQTMKTEAILQDESKIDYQRFREASKNWRELLEERETREDERRRLRSEMDMRETREQQEQDQEVHPYQGMPWYELAAKIETLQAERDRLAHDSRFDPSLRDSLTHTARLLNEALREKKQRMERFKRPSGTLDRNDHKAGKAFRRNNGMNLDS
jgi:hypothetical protein